jgi:peptide/nickel transport system substrate-binding protein
MASESSFWDRCSRARLGRRRLLSAAGASAALALAACGKTTPSSSKPGPSASGAAAPQAGGTLMLRTGTNPPTLDPHRTTSGPTETVVGAVASRLLQYKTGADPKVAEDHEVLGDLAVSVETPDAVTWTVKLRPGARFQNVPPVNGHAVEAADIKAARRWT